jgi:hypothetical protein
VAPAARTLIEGLLDADSVRRLEFGRGLHDHPFFEGIDWQAMRAYKPKPPVELLFFFIRFLISQAVFNFSAGFFSLARSFLAPQLATAIRFFDPAFKLLPT